MQVGVCASTGKAAVRINESMRLQDHGITATTVHRMLGPTHNGHTGDGWDFTHGPKHKLPHRFIWVEESSMLDCNLAASLFSALRDDCHIMLLGDTGQLPPVGHGRPLYDMIAAGLPYGELTVPMRNGGDILRVCADLKAGRPYIPSTNVNLAAGQNVLHIEASRSSHGLQALANLIRSLPSQYNPMDDVQVLCAVNEHTPYSRDHLNRGLQNILNPSAPENQTESTKFRLGDKVCCTTNGLLPLVKCPDCQCELAGFIVWKGSRYACGMCGRKWTPGEGALMDFVANGEIGKVAWAERGAMHVRIDCPGRTVRIAGEQLDQWVLAYALTTHKAQGSQWPIVIVMLDDSNGADRVTSWEHHRTSASRAEVMVVTIGKMSTMHRQCQRSALADRKTFLESLLRGE